MLVLVILNLVKVQQLLSGGEAQRVKLASELQKEVNRENCLYS